MSCMVLHPIPAPQRPTNEKFQSIFHLLELKCSNLRDLHQIHAQMIKTGLISHTPSLTKFLSLTLSLPPPSPPPPPPESNSLAYACMVFNHANQPNIVTWNTMLRGFVNYNLPKMAIMAYLDMIQFSSSIPDRFTFPSLLKACAQCLAFSEGKVLHGQIVRLGLDSDLYVQTTLITMYASCGHLDSASSVFDKMGQQRNEVVWTTMINGYIKNECPKEAMVLFSMMKEEGIEADAVTMASVLSACADLRDLECGKKLHRQIRRSGMTICVVLGTALVDMYAKCGELDLAREVFDALTETNVVAWSAMISGYAQNNRGDEALRLFMKMVGIGDHEPNEVTIMAVLSACAQTGDLNSGKWLHAFVDKTEMCHSISLKNSLIDMYSKCGKIDAAYEIFSEMILKDVVTWNAMISGFALHGREEQALGQFSLMQTAGVKPDDITFIGILSACSNGGFVHEGFDYFHRLKGEYGIMPKLEHYGCMVNLLSRAGMMEEAENFIKEMPMKPNAAVWGALLNGCQIYSNTELGEKAAKHLLDIEPYNEGVYVLLSNMFARNKQWKEVRRLRVLMHEKGIRKAPGCSSIVFDGVFHEFTVGDHSHDESENIYLMLDYVNGRLRAAGHVADTSEVLLNLDEEEKENSLSQHSEKLALCFGLIKTMPGDEILILKNLRVCRDCHSAIKLISKLFKREIVVRDRNRFHHFKEGSCSCQDYW